MKVTIGWHASDEFYDWPSQKMARRNRKGHENGELGLWLTLMIVHDSTRRYGKYLYQAEISPLAVTEILTVRALMDMTDTLKTPDDYARWRQEKRAQGVDVLALQESDGECWQAIVLNLDAITTFKRI